MFINTRVAKFLYIFLKLHIITHNPPQDAASLAITSNIVRENIDGYSSQSIDNNNNDKYFNVIEIKDATNKRQ